ncbi:MAG: endonuclease III [Candidatus Methylomirabilales bacterium]
MAGGAVAKGLSPEAKRVRAIIARLSQRHPDARIMLDFRMPLELLIAAILAAQCTDERVNQVTKTLFRRFRRAADYAEADPDELMALIRPTGFYRNKAKSVIGCCRALVEDHGGEVPDTLEALVKLPGVGRKTANVLLGNAFGRPAIAVDTHVLRVSRRLGLAKSEDPDTIEQELMAVVPRKDWTRFCHLLQAHGRATCKAPRPRCDLCAISDLCPWPEKPSPAGRKRAASRV